MDTTRKNKFKLFHSLMRQHGATLEDKKIMISSYSSNKTRSLRELYDTDSVAFDAMLNSLQVQAETLPANFDAESDRWRKRCIASIGAWLAATNVKTDNRIVYIKQVACRTVDKDHGYFNKLTISQLRTIYNSFIKQRKALESAQAQSNLLTNQN